MFLSRDAYGQLAPFFDESYVAKQLLRLALLPPGLSQLGRDLLGVEILSDPNDYEKQQRRARQMLEKLAGLPQPDRQRLFGALAPSIAKEIEAGWQVFDHLPYCEGRLRRPFRLKKPVSATPLSGSPEASVAQEVASQEVRVAQEANLARSAWVQRLLQIIRGFEQPIAWFATWAAYFSWSGSMLGPLFAGAIDQGGPAGQEVFEILTASARGDHPTGKMGRHVVSGLLCASRPDGWEFITRMLLAAQREEGLRQVIMETADEAHPEAFKRLLRVVLEQNLVRFSAIVRAANVWVGLPFESASPKIVVDVLAKLQAFLESPDSRQAALSAGSPEDQYLALWSIAYEDALQAVQAALPLLRSPQVEQRFVTVYFLSQLQLAESERALLPMLDDEDPRVAVYAYNGVAFRGLDSSWHSESDLFERLERLVARLPEREKTFKPIVWEWMALQVDRKWLADTLVRVLGQRPPARLLPYLKLMYPYTRLKAAKLFQERIDEDPLYRKALMEMAADRDGYVHEKVFELLGKVKPRPDEIPQLEALLTRKTGSLRRGVIGLLLRQPDSALLATIDRLLAQRDEQQRKAGIELLRETALAGRKKAECQARVARLQQEGLGEVEKHTLADLLAAGQQPDDLQPGNLPGNLPGDLPGSSASYTLEDALGLADRSKLSQPEEPRSKNLLFGLVKKTRLGSAAAAACIRALDDLVDAHRTDPIQISDFRGEALTELLGNAHWRLTGPDPDLSIEENRQHFQLAAVWEQWWQERPKALQDEDGLELLRAQAALSLLTSERRGLNEWFQVVPKELRASLDEPYSLTLKYQSMVTYVLYWLSYLHPAPGAVDFLLEAMEETFYRIGQNPHTAGSRSYPNERWQVPINRLGYLNLARMNRRLHKAAWTPTQHARFWNLVRWLEQFTWQKGGFYNMELEDVLLAHKAGAAGVDDLFMFLLGIPEDKSLEAHIRRLVPDATRVYSNTQQFRELRVYSGKHPNPLFAEYPILKEAVERCRERILAVELRRGDLPTAASAPALALRSVPGAANLARLLAALGKTEFERSGYSSNQERATVLSHLVRVSYPLESDTPETFTALMHGARVPERRLAELAIYAPQWAHFVEYTLGWAGLAEGVWWIYAHTKDRQWAVDGEIRESWAAQISEYTPLSADALMDGAVDVAWFQRAYATLGEERWQLLYKAAAYAASGTGHARARLFADAMLGKTGAAELGERIRSKRHQDAVRALGLVPLPEAGFERTAEILRRYETLQEFLRTTRQFGSQRQASEKLAVSIGLENLARTAGYADPQRLEWAMELEAVADLARGPVTVQADGVSLSLSINDLGEAGLEIRRGEKALKNIPPAVKKNEQAAALVERRHALEQQARRMRLSLENAMVRGDEFSAGELAALFGHPILRVMLEQLIFTSPAGMGYPVEGGLALEGLGKRIALAPADRLRLAHPHDLLQSGCWHDWQHDCFITERVQPFKQVFRELYVLTDTEQTDGTQARANFSRRYAGQQVQPRQALALFGARGWVAAPEEGVFKTFHAEGLVARVGFLQAVYTPAEVEGLTIELVGFTPRGEWLPKKLEEVPPRLFSEVMRDLDLVVSVAHAGGVDPEASASTVEARAALVQETCGLLRLGNVRIENRHALVDGKLGNYTIHLGSGTVHKQPGGALCIIPVHAQQRGRLFLPFVDDDPKTAEVISKVLLLARDKEIKDPTILEQIINTP